MKTLVAVNISVILSHHLPEQKHFIIFMPVPYLIFRYGWTMKMFVPELHDVEPAAVHIKMDVALFEIRRTGFPNLDFRVHGFHGLPRCLTDAFAMNFGRDEQQFQFAFGFFSVNFKYHAAHFFTIKDDTIRFSVLAVDGVFNSSARNDFFAFLGPGVAQTKLLLCAVFERPLVVEDELLAVVGLQGHESDIGLLVFHFILDMLLYID